MVTDPIADMFSRIRNAARAKKPAASIPYSRIKMEIAELLMGRGVAGEAAKKGKKNRRVIDLALLYDSSGQSQITEIKRISKPSRRVYRGWRELKKLKGGRGFYIISSPKGIIDDKKAKDLKIGGEVLGEVW